MLPSGNRFSTYLLPFFTICLFLWSNESIRAQITIANEGTENPTLLYQGKPMIAAGPLPEVVIFAVEEHSTYFSLEKWLDWMQQHGLRYGRVYPESGYPWVPYDADKRVFPFEAAKWENGKPLVDITKFNPAYWKNFERVIQACADRGIVLQMQLYQRVFFANKNKTGRWKGNYFNPKNNINQIPVPEGSGGYGIFKAMSHDPFWRDMHVKWVNHILDAIGNKGNVLIDLMNEGASYAVDREWIEFTLDIIEEWEQKTGNNLLVGMDFDHYYKRRDKDLTYILSHPQMELIIGEGSEGHVAPDLVAGDRNIKQQQLAVLYRRQYKKPMISTNSPNLGLHQGIDDLLLYQWYALMVKVQGAGVYAKEYPLDFSDDTICQYAKESRIMSDFFTSLRDYTLLDIASGMIVAAPTDYQLALASPQEVVIYLHTGTYDKTMKAGEKLTLHQVAIPDGPVNVSFINPKTGASIVLDGSVKENTFYADLPVFTESLLIYIVPKDE